MFFSDRSTAGRRLAENLAYLRDRDPVVLSVPRGGVVTGYEVAAALRAPLDVVMVRKLRLPFHRDVAMGAVGEDGSVLLDMALIEALDVPTSQVDLAIRQARAELDRRALAYRGLRPPTPIAGRTVVIVDDGIATGWTMEAACRLARSRHAGSVVAAAPMAMTRVAQRLGDVSDTVVVLDHPVSLMTVGQAYAQYGPVGDDEVRNLLELADQGLRQPA